MRFIVCWGAVGSVGEMVHGGEWWGVVGIALGGLVATIFSTNDSIFGGVMSKINRDK